jgi:hypothetical protein
VAHQLKHWRTWGTSTTMDLRPASLVKVLVAAAAAAAAAAACVVERVTGPAVEVLTPEPDSALDGGHGVGVSVVGGKRPRAVELVRHRRRSCRLCGGTDAGGAARLPSPSFDQGMRSPCGDAVGGWVTHDHTWLYTR